MEDFFRQELEYIEDLRPDIYQHFKSKVKISFIQVCRMSKNSFPVFRAYPRHINEFFAVNTKVILFTIWFQVMELF